MLEYSPSSSSASQLGNIESLDGIFDSIAKGVKSVGKAIAPAGGAIGGAVGGAIGTALLPGVGTGVGAAIGSSLGSSLAKKGTKKIKKKAKDAVSDLFSDKKTTKAIPAFKEIIKGNRGPRLLTTLPAEVKATPWSKGSNGTYTRVLTITGKPGKLADMFWPWPEGSGVKYMVTVKDSKGTVVGTLSGSTAVKKVAVQVKKEVKKLPVPKKSKALLYGAIAAGTVVVGTGIAVAVASSRKKAR